MPIKFVHFSEVISLLSMKMLTEEKGYEYVSSELRKLLCRKERKEETFTPEWKKINQTETDIYFRTLKNSWE